MPDLFWTESYSSPSILGCIPFVSLSKNVSGLLPCLGVQSLDILANTLFLSLLILGRHCRAELNQSIFIVSDFARLDNTVARLDKDIVAPYVHMLPSYNEDNVIDPFSTRKTLLFFRGKTHRKAVSPIIGLSLC